MCTYSISVDDTVLERVKPVLPDDKAVEAWMQSQMDILLLQLAESQTCKMQTEDSINSYSRRIATIHRLLRQEQDLTKPNATSEFFAKGISEALVSYVGTGTITTQDSGTVSAGDFEGAGTGSLSLESGYEESGNHGHQEPHVR